MDLANLRNQFDAKKIDALLISRLSNVAYVSGFRASNVMALVTKNHAYLFTDGRYIEKAVKQAGSEWKVVDMAPSFLSVLHTHLLKHRAHRVGVEVADMSALLYKKIEALPNVKCVDVVGVVEQWREVKTAEELRLIRQSQRLNEQVLKLALESLKTGVTETDIVWNIRRLAHDIGADGLSFDPIVAFGAHTSMPHHQPQPKKKLKRGDMVLIDMGLVYKNYCSDMTRTFFTKTPTKQQADMYQTVLTAQRAAIAAVKPGGKADDVDRAARLFFASSGYHSRFPHATGHGIGLDIHEQPRLAKSDTSLLRPGMVLAIEPGLYIPGKLGVRIEDMVEVTDERFEVLTGFAKEMSQVILKLK